MDNVTYPGHTCQECAQKEYEIQCLIDEHDAMIVDLQHWSGNPVGRLRVGKPKHRKMPVINAYDELPF